MLRRKIFTTTDQLNFSLRLSWLSTTITSSSPLVTTPTVDCNAELKMFPITQAAPLVRNSQECRLDTCQRCLGACMPMELWKAHLTYIHNIRNNYILHCRLYLRCRTAAPQCECEHHSGIEAPVLGWLRPLFSPTGSHSRQI